MSNHIKFEDWQKERESRMPKLDDLKGALNSELIARLNDVHENRGRAAKAKDAYSHQLYDIESKLIKLEMQRNDLIKKREELIEASKISNARRKEGKTNTQLVD